ncbi:MAG: TIR domain-containing protein, partial [Pseudomonadota bacterium]
MSFNYRAFISYSHRDKKWGGWLHKGLERYRIPKVLVGKDTRFGPVPNKIFPVFRDREELPTSSDLSSAIKDALNSSQTLIVICSPNSARSTWVNEEILAFKRLHGEDNILAIIVDGAPNGSDKPGLADQECFPNALRFKMGKSGKLTKTRTEPIAADVREEADGRDNALLKLIAGVLAVNFNDLKQREVAEARKRTRRAQLLAACMGVLAIVAVGAGWFAWAQMKFADHQAGIAAKQRDLAVVAKLDADRERDRSEASRKEANKQKGIAEEKKKEAELSAEEAKKQQAIAQAQKNVAIQQQRLAEKERLNAERSEEEARQQKEIAEREAERAKNSLYKSRVSNSRFYAQEASKLLEDYQSELAASLVLEGLPSNFRKSKDYPVLRSTLDVAYSAANAKRIIAAFYGHSAPISHASFSPNGEKFVTASEDKTARIWDARTGELLNVLQAHNTEIQFSEFSPNGRYILTADSVGNAMLWESESGISLTSYRNELPIKHVSFHPDGNLILLSDDSESRLVGLSNNDTIRTFYGADAITHATFDSTGGLVSLSFLNGTVQIFKVSTGELVNTILDAESAHVIRTEFNKQNDLLLVVNQLSARSFSVATGKLLHTLDGHDHNINYGEFSPDGDLIVTASTDKTAIVWDANTGEKISTLKGHQDTVHSAKFTSDSRRIVTASWGNSVRLWHARAGTVYATYKPETVTIGQNFAEFNPDGTTLLISTYSNNFGQNKYVPITFNARPADEIVNILQFHNSGNSVGNLQFSANGDVFLTTKDRSIDIWDGESGQAIAQFTNESAVFGVQLNSAGTLVATGDIDGFVSIWSIEEQKRLHRISTTKTNEPVFSISFSPDETKVLSGSGEGTAHLWDVGTGMLAQQFAGNRGAVFDIAFNSDGKTVAIVGDRYPRVWSLNSGELLFTLVGHSDDDYAGEVREVSFSRDGAMLLTRNSSEAILWNAHSGEKIRDFSLSDHSINHVEFSPDSSKLVVSLYGERLQALLYDLASGKVISELKLEDEPSKWGSFSPDGKMLATASSNKNIHLWDSANGKLLKTLEQSEFSGVVGFNPNGQRLVSVGVSERIYVFSLRGIEEFRLSKNISDIVAYLKMTELIPLTSEQRSKYFVGASAQSSDRSFSKRVFDEAQRFEILGRQNALKAGATIKNLKLALENYDLATQLFESAGEINAAFRTRIRRATLARLLDPSEVIEVWHRDQNW